MNDIRRQLRRRMRDIIEYLRLLHFVELAGGTPAVHSRDSQFVIPQSTLHVLKAGVFLHVYNLVESAVSAGLKRVAEEIRVTKIPYGDLQESWKKAWVVSVGRLDHKLNDENLIRATMRLCQLVAESAVLEISPRLGSGNLDDREIEGLARRYGIPLTIGRSVQSRVKHEVLNDLGFLGLVKKRRNELAHGLESFSEIGRDYATPDLIRWACWTYAYLKEILRSFEVYLTGAQFRRLPPGAPSHVA